MLRACRVPLQVHLRSQLCLDLRKRATIPPAFVHILERKCPSLLTFLSKNIKENSSRTFRQLWQVNFTHQGVSIRPRRNRFLSWVAEEAVLEGNNGNRDKKLPIIVSLTLKTGILLSGGQSHPLLTKPELDQARTIAFHECQGCERRKRNYVSHQTPKFVVLWQTVGKELQLAKVLYWSSGCSTHQTPPS